MVIPLSPLDAFRADRDQAPEPSADEGVWLQVALLAHRAAALPPHERAPYLSTIRGLQPAASGDVCDVVIEAALQMEDGAYFHLALSTLDAALRLMSLADIDRRGMATAYQARVLRQLDEPEAALDKYNSVIDLGESTTRPSLMARGIVGLGLLARWRGNLPEARQYFNRALRIEEAASDTRRVAHQGLMICAGSAGDLPTAARHAWAAYVESAGADRSVALIDLSVVLLRSGNERAALSGFAAAVREPLLPRNELPALGGLALAAARAASESLAESLVRGADRRLDVLSRTSTLTYLQASALADVADGFSEIGDDLTAASRRQKARDLAARHRYHELLFRLETTMDQDARRAARRESSVVAAPTDIVEAVESITTEERLAETALMLCGA